MPRPQHLQSGSCSAQHAHLSADALCWVRHARHHTLGHPFGRRMGLAGKEKRQSAHPQRALYCASGATDAAAGVSGTCCWV
eukprot:10655379-Alexandrium_andersonii.AAC.1